MGVCNLKKAKYVVLVVGILALINIAVIFIHLYSENKTYQTYLSDIESNQVSSLISNISNVDRTLTEVIQSQSINKNQAGSLIGNFNGIKSQSQNIIELGVRLKKVPVNKLNKVVTTNSNITLYFQNIYGYMTADEINQLASVQLEDLKELQKFIRLYKEEVRINIVGATETGVNGEYWHEYFDNGINKEDWINLMNGMEDVTPKYKDLSLIN